MNLPSHSFLLMTVAASVLAFPAFAEKPTRTTVQGKLFPTYEKCLGTGDASRGVMPAMFDCDRDELARQNDVLNDTYRAVRKNLTPAKQKQLQDLERHWITLRDKKCKAASDEEGGWKYQDGILLWYGCMIAETEQRTNWLKDFARKT